jgi:hypothetical protein
MMEGKTERNGMMDEKTLSILDRKVIPFNFFYQVKDVEIKKKIPKIPLNPPSPPRQRMFKSPSTRNHGTVCPYY